MSHADPATSTPSQPTDVVAPLTAVAQVQGNLWNDFLGRNLLLAGLAGAGVVTATRHTEAEAHRSGGWSGGGG